jgi:ABC-type multidrug transport system fused ATPase/permease subunit
VEVPRLLAARSRRRLLGALVANGVGQAAAVVVTALAVQRAFDDLLARGGARPATLGAYGGVLLAATLLAGWLRARERVDAERLGQHYVHALRMGLYGVLSGLSPRALGRRSRGGVALRFTGDLTAVRMWVSLGLSRLVVSTTFVIGALGALAFVSPALAAAVALVVATGAAGTMLLGRPLESSAREARRRRTRLAANLNEQVAAQPVVQVSGQSRRERRRVRRQSRRLARAMIVRAVAIGRLRGLTEATAGVATTAALLVGAVEVASGRASVGTVAAALTIVGLLVSPLRDLGRVPEYWHNARVALEKVVDFLVTPGSVEDPPGAPDLPPGPGRLELECVELAGSVRGVSALARPGQTVAIVGPNGAGKSSLLALAARLTDPDAGAVRLDGADLRERSLRSVRAAVGVVGPDLPLLRGSVERNLLYRRPDASREELDRVLELCELREVIDGMTDGLRTPVGEGGGWLSAGERQRIALARALLGNPRLLLLDEADANLDATARATLGRVVAAVRGSSTLLVVTHRRETVERADLVWHLEDGRMVEEGTPAELLTGDGPTARLFGAGQAPDDARVISLRPGEPLRGSGRRLAH